MLALPPRTSGAVVGAIMRASKIEEDAVNTTLGTANEVLRTAQNSFRLLFSAADTLITGKRQREHVLERFYVRKDESWADSVPLAA